MVAANQEEIRTWKRRLIVRDSMVFLGLTTVTLALFALTLFLFQSFSSHRVDLAKRWYSRGQRDLAANNPRQAVIDLRTALGYAPEEREYQMLLAEALSEAGDPNEALAYFSNLWEAQPGSGPLNLQLARLTAKSGHESDAVHYYRAAIFGSWEGDGTLRRREVRMELIRYLLSRKELNTAHTEFLIAAGNATDDASSGLEIAGLMVQAGELPMALTQYEKILTRAPRNSAAMVGAGETAFRLQRYASAQRFLASAARHAGGKDLNAEAKEMLEQSDRILDLYPAQELPVTERTRRMVKLRDMAQARWRACQKTISAEVTSEPPMQALAQDWKSQGSMSLSGLRDAAAQQEVLKLIYATEEETAQVCGAPGADDALVLLMARSPGTVEQ